MDLDRQLNWKKHIFSKHKRLGLKLNKMVTKQEFTTRKQNTIIKAILKPIWTYGIYFWSIIANSNVKIVKGPEDNY